VVKQQQPKENPLLGKHLPKPPALPTDQPTQEEQPVINSTLPQNSNAVSNSDIQQNVNTAKQQDTVKQQSSNTAKREKITFYLEPEQADKLYDFMEAFRKRTGVKINQQDMLRRIIDVMTLDTVLP
jgi:hypothetical protein